MKNKYTAGPWRVSSHDDTGEQVVRSVSTLNIVCNCEVDGFGEVGEAETKANAALISAAPDMAEALAAIVKAFSAGDPQYSMNAEEGAAFEQARAALAKAGL